MFSFETLRYFMISTAFTTFMFGFIFLLLFKQSKQRHMLSWGLAFVMYCLMFIIDFSNIGNGFSDSLYVLHRQLFSLLSATLILAGTFHFFGKRFTKAFSLSFFFFIFLLCISVGWKMMYSIFIIPVVMYCSFTLICAGILFILNSQAGGGDPEQYTLSITIILWSIYSNNFPFTRDYLELAISNYFISLILLNGIVILFIVVHFKRNRIALARQEAHYRMLVENASGLIFFYCHEKMKFDYISPAIHLLFDYSTDELYKQPSLLLSDLDEEDTEKMERLFYTPSDSPTNFIFKIHQGGRPVKWYELFSTPILGNRQKPVGVEFVIRDVTARMEAEENYQRSETARKNLIEDISHELRTPVTLIQGYSESILNDMVSPKEYRSYIEIIHSKIITLNTLLEDLVQVSNFTSQSIEYKFYERPASSFFNKILAEYKIFTEKYICRCHNYIDENCVIIVDEYRIGQVFSNLVNNALKYMESVKCIEISCSLISAKSPEGVCNEDNPEEQDFLGPPTGKVRIQIKDFGQGIAPEDFPHLFKRKFRGKEGPNGNRGFGLGLYISREIIKQHGGEIWAENNEDKGASFFFTLPCYLTDSIPSPSSEDL